MTPKQIAAQIYDQYWSDVHKKPVSKQDPLPDIRPLIEKAIIAAAEAEREECAKIVREEFQVWLDSGLSGRECFESAEKRIRARSTTP